MQFVSQLLRRESAVCIWFGTIGLLIVEAGGSASKIYGVELSSERKPRQRSLGPSLCGEPEEGGVAIYQRLTGSSGADVCLW